MSQSELPLRGIRVLDLGQIYNGPYAGFLLAEAGAEVVKVEPISGERLRSRSPSNPPLSMMMFNSNKKGITLDLKHPRGVALFRDLASRADVVLENFAPGVMDKLGVGWQSLKKTNPRLIYATGSGYGVTGPDRDQLAMDHTIQAASGIMSITGTEGGPPIRAGGAVADIMGGAHLYAGITTALVGRERHGTGTLVEISMLETMYPALATELSWLHQTGEVPQPTGSRSATITTPYSIYGTVDGYLALICIQERHWERILEVIGREDLKGDPRFATSVLRHKHEPDVNALIETWSRGQTRDDAVAALHAKRIPVAPVRNVDEVRRDPHMHERGTLTWKNHPVAGDIVLQRSALRFPELDAEPLRFYPELGQHNQDVLGGWLGLTGDDIADLSRAGAI